MIKNLITSIALALALASTAQAELRIEFSGLDLGYNNTADNALFDAGTGGSTGGAGFPGDGDSAFILFYDDSTPLTAEPGWLDFFLPVQQIVLGSDLVSSNNSGYFDILLSSTNGGSGGYGLSIQNVVISDGDFSGNFDLVGSIGNVGSSVLPFPGLNVGDPVRLSFSSQVVTGSLSTTGSTVNSFLANGTGEVSAVPEPGVIALLGLGLLALGFTRRRNQS